MIAFGGPGRPRRLGFDPARGSKPRLSHDSTPFRDALQFFLSKNRPALRLPGTTRPSLASAFHGLAAIVVVLRVRSGCENELRLRLSALVESSRRDEGNLQFDLLYSPEDPGRFLFFERWASVSARLKHHTQSEHIQQFEKHKDRLVERVELYNELINVV